MVRAEFWGQVGGSQAGNTGSHVLLASLAAKLSCPHALLEFLDHPCKKWERQPIWDTARVVRDRWALHRDANAT